MLAEIKPRIDLKNRTKLETVIPLRVPFIINVDPSDTCNFQCKFCPTGNRALMKNTPGRNHGIMDFDLFKKIVNDICEFETPIKVLRLYKDGEPLLNPRLAEMIKYAKDMKCSARIDTTTNASLLTPEKNLDLISAGLDRINISIEGINSSQYQSFSKYKVDFEKLVNSIRHFYENIKQCEMIVKINGDTLSEDDKKSFFEIFGNIADGVYIEHVMSCWPEFELDGVQINREFGIYGQKIREVQVCPYIFYSFSVNSDGTASACFLDWSRKLIIGDAKSERIKDIWNGEKLYEYRKQFLLMKRKHHPVCGQCGQLSHGLPDDIDPFAEELLKKLLTSRQVQG
ncbi:MAG: radical SAM protein [Clostridiales bacterium]|nr:radical SAM protein [Clostridiales bacterium]